jgi:beta-ureidopropionase / N-carbamoyl-L-amino-acid hydrolase
MKQRAGTAEQNVNPERLWARHMELATVGGLANGGVDRQALTPEEARARAMVLAWAKAIDLTPAIDPVGNLFLRYAGQQPEARPVMAGSHLDTQPIGGRFDGVYGVLAALEAMTALRGMGWEPERPIDLVMWTNEEGCRFAPTTMGSSAFAGALSVDEVLATRDHAGVSVAEALDVVMEILGPMPSRPLGFPIHAFLEIHIEQGPMLEAHGCPVGVVTGVQGLRWFNIDVRGQAGHAGTTPENHRRDALVTALRILGALRELMFGGEDCPDVCFTVGRFEVFPGAPNTIPGRVRFTIDLRHPDADRLKQLGDAIEGVCQRLAEPCAVSVEAGQSSPPIHFDKSMVRLLDGAARSENIQPLHLMSGATHDAKWLGTVAPTGMLFVPCAGGISHNEAESAELDDLVAGSRVMCRALRELSAA